MNIDFTTVISFAIVWKFGTASDIHIPPAPCCVNMRGVPHELRHSAREGEGLALHKLVRRILPVSFHELRLVIENIEECGGAPDMCR